MNKKLRAYLESIGLRAEATEAEAWEFFEALKDDQKTRADALKEGERDEPQDPPADPPPNNNERNDPPADPPADQPADPEAIARAAVAAERQRVIGLRQLAADDVPAEILQRAIDEGTSVANAATLFMQGLRDSRGPDGPAVHSRSRDRDVNVRSLAAAMLATDGFDPTKHSMHNGRIAPRAADRLTEQDAELGDRMRGMGYYDIVRECIWAATGQHVRTIDGALETLRSSAVSGATLSNVFTTNIYARLLEAWDETPDTTQGWCDEEDVANFMTQTDISIAADAHMQRLPRGDTAKHATASDSAETYSIARYAKQFVVDEQDLIDDRLGAIMRMPAEMGEAARALRPDMVYSLILQNPTMTDTGAVFNSTAITTAGGHANLGTAVLGDSGLKAAITAMVQQRLNRSSTNPGRQLNIRPNYLIVPAALEWVARALVASAALAKLFADSSEPFYSTLNLIAQEGIKVVADDRIGAIGVFDPRSEAARTGSDTAWYLAEGGRRGLRVAYRRGTNRRPSLRSFTLDRGQWGLGWDIDHDLGVAFTEWRTWYMSDGTG